MKQRGNPAPKSIRLLTSAALALIVVSLFSISKSAPQQEIPAGPGIDSTRALLERIKERDSAGHLKAFTFVQQTIRYDEAGAVRDTSTWYEAIRYPKEFRIDFGDPEAGNANINRNDSIYVFRGHKLVHSGPEVQEFLILEGGIFYYSTEETEQRLTALGIDTTIFSESEYKGRPVYILGAREGEPDRPQIWLDATEFYVVRRFSRGGQGELYEVRYDDFLNIGGYRIESWIEFYRDGSLIQTERYNKIDVHPELEDADFDPGRFGRRYWFKG